MINRIIEFSIKNKLIIGLLTLALIGGGIWSMTKVPIDAVPDITNNQVQVITQAPNLATEDIEQFVTYPVEVAMSNLPGVMEIRSVSRFGLSVVTIVFEDNMDTYLPRQLVQEKLAKVRDEIPEGFGDPTMGPITTGLGEIYQYTLDVDSAHQDKYSLTDLRTMQDWIIRRQMAMVPGVVEVNGFGGKIKQYEVAVNPEELKAIGLTITDVFNALEANNQNTGGAYIEKNHKANFVRGEGLARTLEDIENIVVQNKNSVPIRIKDVATVQFGSAVRYGAFTKNGNGEGVGGMIMMLKGANSNAVIQAVKERMTEIEKSLPEGIRIEPYLDRSELIEDTTSTVSTNLIEGGLIVILVLVLLLGNWRGGLIVASTIPLSLLFAFILMNVFGVWANLMSLGAIDFGIIVDGAVIIVESTVYFLNRRVMQGHSLNAGDRNNIALNSSKRMMNTAFFGQLIILIVFLPIMALEGVEGKMFRPMAMTFGFAMIGAMILCLTYVPMMSAWVLRVPASGRKSWGYRIVEWLQHKFEPVLEGALNRAWYVVAAAVVLLALAIFTFTRMGGEFVPQLDEGDIAFHIILKPGSSLSESIEASTKVENILLENFPEVEKTMTRFGVADVPTDPMPMDIGDCFIILKPKDEWVTADNKEELIARIKEELSVLPGLSYEFTQPIEMRFNELITGVREDIAVKLFGEDLQVLADKGEEMGRIISNVEGVADMNVEATTGLPQMTVNYNRNKLAQYGLNISELNQVVQSAFAGGKAGVIFEGERRFDLVVRLDSTHRQDLDDLKALYVNLPNGSQIPLNEVADVSYEPGPMQISRDNTNRRTYVGINVRGRDIESLVGEIKQKLEAELELPPGYYIRYGGAFENLERATNRLQLVVPLALGLIFILIFFALRSIKQTMMIYMAIPMAAIGGVFSLWLRDMPFSISAGVGFVVLFGVAVLNGLVLINGLNELKREGVNNLRHRIVQGTGRRIRPILLTALTDVLGFMPMALSTSAGAEVQRPLATVVIGGLITSTLLTLFVLPILYQWTESKSLRVKPAAAGVLLAGLLVLGGTSTMQAQPSDTLSKLNMQEAVQMAKAHYPKLKAAQLEVENQQFLKKTAWDMGITQLQTGGSELNNEGQGVYTYAGIEHQQMEVFGVGSKKQLADRQIELAQKAYDLTERQLEQKVKQSWSEVMVAKKQWRLHVRLDSLFSGFERAARIRYETEETSRLDWLSAGNQARQIHLKRQQTYRDYQMALQRMNLWLDEEEVYSVTMPHDSTWLPATIPSEADSIVSHPSLAYSNQQLAVASQLVSVAKADFWPKLNAQFGLQEVNGEAGFYRYQLGFSIPLFFAPEKGRLQSARVQHKIAEQQFYQQEMELHANYREAWQRYQKWQESWEYFMEEALPLAREQRKGAITAYREGAIDYITFLQHIKDAVQVEEKANEALGNYLNSKAELEYFIENN